MKSIILFLVGLLIGAFATVAGISALRQGTPYNDAVMSVLGQQMGAFKGMRESGKCDMPDVVRRLTLMQAVAGEVDAAFLPVGDDAKFSQLSRDMRDALAKAGDTVATQAATSNASCETLGQVMPDIGATCKGCHDVFR